MLYSELCSVSSFLIFFAKLFRNFRNNDPCARNINSATLRIMFLQLSLKIGGSVLDVANDGYNFKKQKELDKHSESLESL